MNRKPANADMVEGYTDGLNLDNPEPSANRSHSYRHGFRAGRADRGQFWGLPFETVDRMADDAMQADAEIAMSPPPQPEAER